VYLLGTFATGDHSDVIALVGSGYP